MAISGEPMSPEYSPEKWFFEVERSLDFSGLIVQVRYSQFIDMIEL